MSKDKGKSHTVTTASQEATVQTQGQRRLKYGSNVAIAILLVVVLGVGLIYLSQRFHRRTDMTSLGLYSLKPQTVNIISQNKTPIRLISLYTTASDDRQLNEYAGRVADLLNEYKSKGANISVELIDPVRESGKIDALIKDLVTHDPEIAKYKELITQFQAALGPIRQEVLDEASRIATLPINQLESNDSDSFLRQVAGALPQMAKDLDEVSNRVNRLVDKNPPDYSAAVAEIHATIDAVQQNANAISIQYARADAKAPLPQSVIDYKAQAIGRWKQIGQQCQAILTQEQTLGKLRIDTIQPSLERGQTVLVISDTDTRVLSFDRIWPEPNPLTAVASSSTKLQRTFAGEQEISSAIYSLTSEHKPTIVFVRTGGSPLTENSGPFRYVAARLRQYNFQVLEKDISGQWAMQSQMGGMEATPEATDQQLKDGVWVVLPEQSASLTGRMQPSAIPNLMEHLAGGGSALVMFSYQSEPMAELLEPWGIRVHTDAVMAHPEAGADAAETDMISTYLRTNFFWVLRDYGESPLATPLKNIGSLIIMSCPVTLVPDAKDVKVWPILSFPKAPDAWAEKNTEQIEKSSGATYQPTEDQALEAYVGAAAEKANGARLVVMGVPNYAIDPIQTIPDPDSLRRGEFVSRFPGNAELFMNQAFWLSKLDTMIAISPASMTVSRLSPTMTDSVKQTWWIIVAGGLPLLVLVSGIIVALRRRG